MCCAPRTSPNLLKSLLLHYTLQIILSSHPLTYPLSLFLWLYIAFDIFSPLLSSLLIYNLQPPCPFFLLGLSPSSSLCSGLNLPKKRNISNFITKLPFTSRDLNATLLIDRKLGLEKYLQVIVCMEVHVVLIFSTMV